MPTDGDKMMRAHTIVPTYEAGVILSPEGATAGLVVRPRKRCMLLKTVVFEYLATGVSWYVPCVARAALGVCASACWGSPTRIPKPRLRAIPGP